MSTIRHTNLRSRPATARTRRPGWRAALFLALTLLCQTLLPHVHAAQHPEAIGETSAYAARAQHADAPCPACQALSHRPALLAPSSTPTPPNAVRPWTPCTPPPAAGISLVARHAPRSPPVVAL
ncbi:MAG TPA: hypothetical protein VIS07_19535 [Candidatus Binatia bacterium]